MTGGLPVPNTREGRAALAEILRDPDSALIASDFDGTLAPIVSDPRAARPYPGAVAVLRRLSKLVGSVAVITGRRAARAVELGGLDGIPGLIVLGQYGWERWENGVLSSPLPPPGVAAARGRLPELAAGAPEGIWVEDKVHALAVHTRRTADPEGTLERLAGPLAELAAATGLMCEPGRMVIELRPPGTDKGSALSALAAERNAKTVLFAGDDLGDLPAFAAVRAWRESGHLGLIVCSDSEEVTELAAQADIAVEGPAGVSGLLSSLAGAISAT